MRFFHCVLRTASLYYLCFVCCFIVLFVLHCTTHLGVQALRTLIERCSTMGSSPVACCIQLPQIYLYYLIKKNVSVGYKIHPASVLHKTYHQSAHKKTTMLQTSETTTDLPVRTDRIEVWESCCLRLDKRIVVFMSQLSTSLTIIFFCMFMLCAYRDCETFARYSPLLTLVIGVWLPQPRMIK
jgi:hypothetical protein